MKKRFLYGITTLALVGVLTSCGGPDLGQKVNKEEFRRQLNTTAQETAVEDQTPTGIKLNANFSSGIKVQVPGTKTGVSVDCKLVVEMNDSKLHASMVATSKEAIQAAGASQEGSLSLVSNLWVAYSGNVLKAWSELATKNSLDPTANVNLKTFATAQTGDMTAQKIDDFLKQTYQSYSHEVPEDMLAELDSFLVNVEQNDPNYGLYVKGEGNSAKYSLTCNVQSEEFKGSALASIDFQKAKLAGIAFSFKAEPVIKGLGQYIAMNLGVSLSAFKGQIDVPTSDEGYTEGNFENIVNGVYDA